MADEIEVLEDVTEADVPDAAVNAATVNVGDIVDGRPVFGVRKVEGETFIAFEGGDWLKLS